MVKPVLLIPQMPHAFLSGRNISGPNLPLALGGSSDRSGPLDLQQRPQVPGGVIGLGGKKNRKCHEMSER